MLKLFVALSVAAAVPAVAQAPVSPPAPTVPPAPSTLGVDTPIETLVANPAAKQVLDTNLPGLTGHAMYDQFKAMSLTELMPLSQGAITEERLAKIKAELAALK